VKITAGKAVQKLRKLITSGTALTAGQAAKLKPVQENYSCLSPDESIVNRLRRIVRALYQAISHIAFRIMLRAPP
jgi:hypothetical protein